MSKIRLGEWQRKMLCVIAAHGGVIHSFSESVEFAGCLFACPSRAGAMSINHHSQDYAQAKRNLERLVALHVLRANGKTIQITDLGMDTMQREADKFRQHYEYLRRQSYHAGGEIPSYDDRMAEMRAKLYTVLPKTTPVFCAYCKHEMEKVDGWWQCVNIECANGQGRDD